MLILYYFCLGALILRILVGNFNYSLNKLDLHLTLILRHHKIIIIWISNIRSLFDITHLFKVIRVDIINDLINVQEGNWNGTWKNLFLVNHLLGNHQVGLQLEPRERISRNNILPLLDLWWIYLKRRLFDDFLAHRFLCGGYREYNIVSAGKTLLSLDRPWLPLLTAARTPLDEDAIFEFILGLQEYFSNFQFHKLLSLNKTLLDTLWGATKIVDNHVHKKFLFGVFLLHVPNPFQKLWRVLFMQV